MDTLISLIEGSLVASSEKLAAVKEEDSDFIVSCFTSFWYTIMYNKGTQ